VFRAWRRCREQGKLHFPCDGLRRLPFCTLAARERLAAASHSLPSSPNERNGGDTIAIYHCSIKIVSRGKGKSAVAAAAYRSGEKLTNEWDGLTHDYTKKGGVVHSEILLPAHAPPAFSDRSTLWNSVELSEKSNNAQLAREVEIALPVELSREEQTRLVREYCSSQFVSKGMIADFNLHDTGGGNPHAHILLTMRPLDERGAWLPKSKKEYVLDKNGEKIRLPSGRYKTRKVDLVDWNNRENAEVWRRAWADLANDFLAQNNRPERIDHRSYERQGIDQLPTVHVRVSATQMEKKGIVTERGELNRNIKAANRILREIRRLVRGLKDWIAELKERKAALLEALTEARAQASEPTIPQLLARYMEQRGEERADWTSKGKLKGAVSDFNKVQAAMEFLRQKEISTVETLDRQLDGISENAVAIRDSMRKAERRIKDIDTLLSHIGNYEKYKPVYKEYAAIGWKKQKEKFAEAHRGELDAYLAAARYVKTHLPGTSYSRKELEAERKDLAAALPGKREELEAVQADVRTLRDVRHWLNQVLPPEQYRQTAEPGKKPSIVEGLKGREQRIRQEQEKRQQPPRTQKQQDMEL
jgi:predicted  nucleic acid-binding Zn-ribbon protein